MKVLVRVSGILLAGPTLLLGLFAITGPATWSALAYVLAVAMLVAALVVNRRPQSKRLLLCAVAVSATTLCARACTADHGRHLAARTGASSGSRVVDRLLDERDVSVNAARAIRMTRTMTDPDVATLPEIMDAAYVRMKRDEGQTPSPFVATYLGLQRAEAYDEIEIGDVGAAHGVILFLHGFAGSFTLPCWELSLAATRAGFATACPATRWIGDWWSAQGEAIVRASISDLKRRGAKQIVLAGLSNGGIGASLLAPRLGADVAGLIVISGASPEAVAPHVPVLAFQGRRDAQIPASVVRAYASRTGGRYVEVEAGHFAMLVREQEFLHAMTSWLAR